MSNMELAKLLKEYNKTLKDIEDLVLYITGKFTINDINNIKKYENKTRLLTLTIEQGFDELNDGIDELLNNEDISENIKKYWVEETARILLKRVQSKLYIKNIIFLLNAYKEGKFNE